MIAKPSDIDAKARAAAWPDWPRWMAFLWFMALFYAMFFPVYFGGDLIAMRTGRAYRLYFEWETRIPILPWMLLPYLSLFSLFLLPLAHLRPAEIQQLSRQSTFVLAVAGIIFLAVPTKAGFPITAHAGLLQPIFDLIQTIDARHNLVPSLHVAFSTLLLLGCAARARPAYAVSYRLWLIVISTSTVLAHRHHLLDVGMGFGLALAARHIFPLNSIGERAIKSGTA